MPHQTLHISNFLGSGYQTCELLAFHNCSFQEFICPSPPPIEIYNGKCENCSVLICKRTARVWSLIHHERLILKFLSFYTHQTRTSWELWKPVPWFVWLDDLSSPLIHQVLWSIKFSDPSSSLILQVLWSIKFSDSRLSACRWFLYPAAPSRYQVEVYPSQRWRNNLCRTVLE